MVLCYGVICLWHGDGAVMMRDYGAEGMSYVGVKMEDWDIRDRDGILSVATQWC